VRSGEFAAEHDIEPVIDESAVVKEDLPRLDLELVR
jgi:hypothetical protein